MDASYTLSDQQTIILTMVAQGYTRKEIADALFISVGTVRTHRDRIRANLNVTCTESAVLIAIQLGIISVDEIEVQLKDPTLPIPDHLKQPSPSVAGLPAVSMGTPPILLSQP